MLIIKIALTSFFYVQYYLTISIVTFLNIFKILQKIFHKAENDIQKINPFSIARDDIYLELCID